LFVLINRRWEFPVTQTQIFMIIKDSRVADYKAFKCIKNQFYLTAILLFVLLTPSCIPHSKIVYLQRDADAVDTIHSVKPDYRIKNGDILYIQVLTLDEESYGMFNSDRSSQRTTQSGGGGIGNPQMFLSGYNVDEYGNVMMPVVGIVNVSGLTISEATDQIGKRVEEYLHGATVLVKLVNFSVTILGEVRSPGKYYVYDNRVNIIDIISVAGDLTDFGNRNLTIVRQTSEGAAFGSINLNDAQAIKSEYFYLQPNDIVYVEPHKLKRLGISQFPISLVFSTISFTLFLITYFSK
jgi:polysaccharide biosynthesis/export protein